MRNANYEVTWYDNDGEIINRIERIMPAPGRWLGMCAQATQVINEHDRHRHVKTKCPGSHCLGTDSLNIQPDLQIFKKHRESLSAFLQQRGHQLDHLGMGATRRAQRSQVEHMAPLPHVTAHNNFRLERVGQQAAGKFGGHWLGRILGGSEQI